jgi:tRNA dimethylallyltransferase
MSSSAFRHAWVLTGPTGSGKSEYALRLAESYNAEIVAMDSMTLYRGMDVGTAKPTLEDRRRVRHHLIDVLDPWESANVAWWLERAGECCREIESRGKRALFVGGTPLYLKAMLAGLFDGPPANTEIRARLESMALGEGVEVLHRRLAEVDAATAQRLHPNDVRRVIRALEVWELTQRPISVWQQQWHNEPLAMPAVKQCWWIDRPRSELYKRINERVERMVGSGWIEEARRLQQLPRPMSREADLALGYREIFAYLQGKSNLAATVSLIQTRSRQFAKRQLTWFRNMPDCRRLEVSGDHFPDPATQFFA